MTNIEIQQAYKAGRLDTRAKNAIDRALHGTLDPGFRRQLVSDIGLAARAARQTANSYKPKATPQNAPSKGIVSISDAMNLPKYKGKSRQEVSDAITAQGYTPQ